MSNSVSEWLHDSILARASDAAWSNVFDVPLALKPISLPIMSFFSDELGFSALNKDTQDCMGSEATL